MSAVINAPVFADVPVREFQPGPAGTHITIRGLTKYFAGWPLYEDFNLDIPSTRSFRCSAPTAAASPR
jgi:NitT/TauT family transport system ATP-binding protein